VLATSSSPCANRLLLLSLASTPTVQHTYAKYINSSRSRTSVITAIQMTLLGTEARVTVTPSLQIRNPDIVSGTPWYLQNSLGQRVVDEVQTYLRSEACKKAHKYKVGEETASDLIAEHPFPPDPRRSQSQFDFAWHIVDSVVEQFRKELRNDLQEAEKDVLRDLVNFTGR